MNNGKVSFKIAICGILTALSVAWMLVAGFFGVLTYAAPMIAGGMLIVPVKEYGCKTALTMFAAVSLLGMILIPDKELALFYLLLFGHYPIMQPFVNRIYVKPLRVAVKAVIFNGCSVLAVWLAQVIFGIPIADGDKLSWFLLAVFLATANVCFALYDRALLQFYTIYDVKLRVLLHRLFRF